MANTIYDTTNRVRIKPGLIYDLQCELMTEHSNIIARIIHDSNIDEENIFVPIKFTHRWATVSPESDYDEIAGWACRLYRDLPADHPYGSGKIYDPDEATLKRLLIPGKMDTDVADHTILQLLRDLYVSNPDHTITAISIFMSLEIEKDQLFERLNYIHKREWIKLSGSNSNKWLLKYSISPQAIEKIEERLISYSNSGRSDPDKNVDKSPEKVNEKIAEIEKNATEERDSRKVNEKNKLDVNIFLIENSISEDNLEEALNILIDLPVSVDISSYEEDIAKPYKLVINHAISKNQSKIAADASNFLTDLAKTKKKELTAVAEFYQAKVAFAENNIAQSEDFIFTIMYELSDFFDGPLLTEIYKWLREVNFQSEELISLVKDTLAQVLSTKSIKPKEKAKPIPGTDANKDAEIEAYFENDQEAEGELFLGYEEYANAFVSFIDGEENVDQLVIGLHGEWGRGKSTLMGKIKSKLDNLEYLTAELNAWKYHKEENIWAAFLHTILTQIPKNMNLGWRIYYKLNLFRHIKFIGWIIIPLILAGVIFTILNNSFFTSILLLGVVPVFYLIKKILGSVKKIVELVNWFKMKYFKKYDYKDSLGIIGKLDSDLANLTKVFSRVNRKKGPIIIFIDDLDRCPPNRVVEVINAINTLTLSKGFIFFLGYDRKYVASAICAEYKEMIGIYYEHKRDKLQFGYEFLDKIIQIPFRIPVGSMTEIHKFVRERLKLKIEHYLEPNEIATVEPAVIIPESKEDFKNISQKSESEEESKTKSADSETDLEKPKEKISKDQLNVITGSILKSAVSEYRLTNPRKIKKFINTFKLMSYIALEQRIGGIGNFSLKQLGFLMFFESNYRAELKYILSDLKQEDMQMGADINNNTTGKIEEHLMNVDIRNKMEKELNNLFGVKNRKNLKEKTEPVLNFISGALT